MSDTPKRGVRALLALTLEFLMFYFPIFVILSAILGSIGFIFGSIGGNTYSPYESVPIGVPIALIVAIPIAIYFLRQRRANRYPGNY